MKLILLQDVDNLGEEGDIVTVKDGYGRNYLIPKRLAAIATDGVIRHHEDVQRQRARKIAKVREDAEALKKDLESTKVVISARTGEENCIFGTVTSQQIAVELAKQGFEVDRKNIEIDEDIRVIGVNSATVKLFKNVEAKLTIEVIPETGPRS